MTYEENLLHDLNDEQKAAVTFGDGPCMIVAGAGTGKTTVITRRIAWLIHSKKCKAEELLALTFTEKAAAEMEERADRLLPYGYVNLWILTFHAFCERVLRVHGLDIGLPTDFTLLDQTSAWLLVRKNISRFNLDYYRPTGNPTKFIHALLKHFSRAKDEEISPVQYGEHAEKLKLHTDTAGDTDSAQGCEAQRIAEVADAYHTYQQILLENSALDFGDLIVYTLKLFRERPVILEKYRKQFKYILVDEFQDTNWAQYELVKLLAAPVNNLTVVGDDDQCLPANSSISLPDNHKKNIKDIRAGDIVLTAVGKGHIGVSQVNRIWKRTAQQEMVTIKTEHGAHISATRNHKMFCYVPAKSDKKHFYVYLMHRRNMGWRIGTTNDLSVRLRLERSADYIIGIKACVNDAEARYYETLWSLFYGIPTACFKERKRIVMKGEYLQKLYQELDVDKNVHRLACDLGIALDAYHACLDAVNRGSGRRIKILISMCYRNYRSKEHVRRGKAILYKAPISHILSVETSDSSVIKKIEDAGFNWRKGKGNGRILRITSSDMREIQLKAEEIKKITGGIIECRFAVGRLQYQHLPARIIPAGNLLIGHYIPVRRGGEIEYEKIVSIKKKQKTQEVYDLEIDRTHNFIANSVVVHNSVYKFRGASLANILEFKKDFPQSREVFLVKNYRSGQKILDTAYAFIQKNNPNRLEYQLAEGDNRENGVSSQTRSGIQYHECMDSRVKPENDRKKFRDDNEAVITASTLSKKLVSQTLSPGSVVHIHCATHQEEVEKVLEKISELKAEKSDLLWSDFAILVRSNNLANPFISMFTEHSIPYQFFGLKGLYMKQAIVDALAYFKVVENFHDGPALYRVLAFPFFNIHTGALVQLGYNARKNGHSLWQAAKKIDADSEVLDDDKKKIEKIIADIERHADMARRRSLSEVFFSFLKDTGYLMDVSSADTDYRRDALNYLNQLFQKAKDFQSEYPSARLRDFMELVAFEQEAGDAGALAVDSETGPDAVRIMTVHGAKGLEFRYVFVVNMVDRKFPTIERDEEIDIPTALIKEPLQEGDVHLEEERRLFYVALTRAKEGVFLTSAADYGGARKRKLSQFLNELEFTQCHSEQSALLRQSKASSRNPVRSGSAENPERIIGENIGISGKAGSGSAWLHKYSIQNDRDDASHNSIVIPAKAGIQIDGCTEDHGFPIELGMTSKSWTIPSHFSFTQLAAFQKCPLQYKFSFLLHVPVLGKWQFSFGKSIHATLEEFFNRLLKERDPQQDALSRTSETRYTTDTTSLPPFEDLIEIYTRQWIDEWYGSQKEKDDRFSEGKEMLRRVYTELSEMPFRTTDIEKDITIKIGSYPECITIRGRIDRIDTFQDGTVEIIDYKTGEAKQEEKLRAEDKEQLIIYQIACEEVLGKKPARLTYWYLKDGSKISFLASPKEIQKWKEKISQTAQKIRSSDFAATPGFHCRFCDYRDICEFRQM
ncbi:UvrD-helicase domain-containing protein [Candidatus Uhrbacteria bacterium]|nr:UvrD-helicase domain-containing protein [Candidatus Uhrbacteria bacterium]